MEFFKNNFFYIDFLIGSICFVTIFFLYKSKRIDRYLWYLFWIGVMLGFTWEFGCNVQMLISDTPVARFLKPLPVHWMVIVAFHSIWDGSLFLIGVWLVKKICVAPQLDRFKISELLILLIWGQVQELIVELTSTYSDGWEWVPYSWNPTLFMFNGHHITLFPQLIWFVAIIVFYFFAIVLGRKLQIRTA